jgi:hypothetical protein
MLWEWWAYGTPVLFYAALLAANAFTIRWNLRESRQQERVLEALEAQAELDDRDTPKG